MMKKLLVLFFMSFSMAKAQQIPLEKIIINEDLRDELIVVNKYVKELKKIKVIPEEPIFIRFEAGESLVGEVLFLRFLGNYYRNLSNGEELYYKTNDNVFYVFEKESISYLKSSLNFSLIKNNNHLKDYGEAETDFNGFNLEMGELIFDKSCGKYYLSLVTGMPRIDIYYKLKF